MALAPSSSAHAASKGDETALLSPSSLLNEDGTLRIDGNTSGVLDLDGWSVQVDLLLGPVFTPQATLDNWAGVGSFGGAFDAQINAIVIDGSNVYVGGSFLNAGGVPEADRIAKWDGSAWTALSNGGSGQPALNGSPVNDLLFVNGNLYVAGKFVALDTSGAAIPNSINLAKWNGSVWSAVPGITSPLSGFAAYELAYDPTNNILYVGGEHTNVNGNTEADYVFGINLADNSLVTLGHNGSSDGALNAMVTALAVDSTGNVYVGGFFTDVSNNGTPLTEADRVAMWNGTNWSALGNNGVGVGALNGVVGAIAVDSSDNVYVGGSFTNAAGIAQADYIAKWDGANWSALGSNGSGNGALLSASGGTNIQEIVINGSDIYVGGFFTGASVLDADYAARFDTNTSTWHGLGGNGAGDGSLNGGVVGMAFNGGNLYMGGYFYKVNDNGSLLNGGSYFAIWNGSNWSTLGNYTDGVLNSTVDTIAMLGTDVYIGGAFTNLGGDARIDYLARWDGLEWNPVGNLTQSYGSLNGRVRALIVDGTDLYAGGDFTTAYNEGSSLVANYVAKWDGSDWSALGNGVNSSVYVLALDTNQDLYVGGNFTNVDSIPEADYIAKWDGANWSALAGNGASAGTLDNTVFALAAQGTDIYVGGRFTSAKNTSNTAIPNTAYLAKWNGSAWSAVDNITSPLNDEVLALTYSGGSLYVGGKFTNLNGLDAADRIAKWNGSSWSALGSNGFGGGAIINYVKTIAISGNAVYVGGIFNSVNNSSGTSIDAANYVAQFDGVNWSSLGDDGGGEGSIGSGAVYVLMVVDNDLWVGGDFENVNNSGTPLPEADYLATYGINGNPAVTLVARADANPTAKTSVAFNVYFSEPVTGVDETDFTLGIAPSGASITGVTGSDAAYTVTVNTGTGNGTLRLDVLDDDTIMDNNSNPLEGTYTNGQTYTVNKKSTFKSQGTNDGWILESTETSSVGGAKNNGATTINIGDDATKKQYRGILSFNTSSLPENAVITKVTLKVKKAGVVGGGNPITVFNGFMVDIKKGNFGTASLELGDFNTASSKTLGAFKPSLSSGWYAINLTTGNAYINLTGNTQIRLRFKLDDNNNLVANFLKLYSGNAGSAARPQLIIEYYVP